MADGNGGESLYVWIPIKFIGFLTADLFGIIELLECPPIILSLSFGGEEFIEFLLRLLPIKLSLLTLIDSNRKVYSFLRELLLSFYLK